LIESDTGPFITVGLEDGQRITLDRQKAHERGPVILDRYNLRFDRSKDLRQASAKAGAKKKTRPTKG
jgi:hypothetical protein